MSRGEGDLATSPIDLQHRWQWLNSAEPALRRQSSALGAQAAARFS